MSFGRPEMSKTDNVALTILIILILIFLLPLGWVMVAFPAEPYRIVVGDPISEAAQNAGLTIINATNVTWNFPGALGGKIYVLKDKSGNMLTLQTQLFASTESRDAAIQAHSAQSVGKGKPIGTIVIIGQEVVYIPPDQGGILADLGPELLKKQAGR
jgi:hypothetical protein